MRRSLKDGSLLDTSQFLPTAVSSPVPSGFS